MGIYEDKQDRIKEYRKSLLELREKNGAELKKVGVGVLGFWP